MFNQKYKEKTDSFGKIIILDNLTEFANKEELKWRNEEQFSKDEKYNDFEKWQKIYSDGRNCIPKFLNKKFHFKGKILEIGAGSGWLTSYISRFNDIEKVYALDYSFVTLSENFPRVGKWMDANRNKIIRVLGDFHSLPFEDNSLDFVLCDAALHHSNHPDIILREVKRILKKEGIFLASSEPIASKWRVKEQKRDFGKEEKEHGITENIFTRDEWILFFKKAGFNLEFIPFIFSENSSKLKNFIKKYTPLRFFNEYLFSNYVFYVKR